MTAMSDDAGSGPRPRTPNPATPISPAQWGFLREEVHRWERDGLIDGPTATAIRGRYVEQHRFGFAQLALGLGGSLVVVGLIWLVASNLDLVSPLVRFAIVVLIWLALMFGSERLDGAVAGAGRLLAAGAFGAVVFQAAQSLQVPAYEPKLVLAWAVGALVYAYAVRSHAALVVGLGALTVWFVWQSAETANGIIGFIAALLFAAVLALAGALLHPSSWASFAGVWRFVAAALLFAGLFASSLPNYNDRGEWPVVLTIGIVVALIAAAAAAVRADRLDRLEIAGASVLAVAGLGLALWWPGDSMDTANGVQALSAAMWVRTGLSLVVYLAAAVAVALIGERRDAPSLTALAVAAVVIFTTVQAWAVFAPIISGATLFLVVGLIMLASGVLAERTRRQLAKGDHGPIGATA